MDKLLDEAGSLEIAAQIKSKAKKPFENAYQALLATEGAVYAQGFLVIKRKPYQLLEHAWIELDSRILDPNLPHLAKKSQEMWYFTAQTFTGKKLKAIIEESKEDYPEDDPLPIYGDAPYEYYGDVMLGGKEYLTAYQAAAAKCQELNQSNLENN
ncbi:hypothetical protein IQ247_22010 [Plectonema cf. radiosum LEGE 06105]|uniref:Uncharacterized protein n=1 Tax=Plectonema cf. radiosum LEGE 06105 TaxID=945769 RepID=A0A8J7FF23_9CYAN|nr:hypothetical protein [Plectonema radiosum]MBE9215303.1 hypothetical protein [Plectonema cf. radiosum LEGE 06105]